MRALSVKQPWAWMIAHGIKTVENRRWMTSVRGPVLIHASQTIDPVGLTVASERHIEIPATELYLGGIVGIVDILRCVEIGDEPSWCGYYAWMTGPYCFILGGARPLAFYACRGKQRFFDVQYPLPLPTPVRVVDQPLQIVIGADEGCERGGGGTGRAQEEKPVIAR